MSSGYDDGANSFSSGILRSFVLLIDGKLYNMDEHFIIAESRATLPMPITF